MENLSICIVHGNFATLLMEVFLLPCHMPQVSKRIFHACIKPVNCNQGIFHSSHKKRARAFWTQFYESQLLSFLASNLPLVSALLSTVHCFCHMQASSIALFAATSSAHTARRVCSQLAVPPVACQLSRAL